MVSPIEKKQEKIILNYRFGMVSPIEKKPKKKFVGFIEKKTKAQKILGAFLVTPFW